MQSQQLLKDWFDKEGRKKGWLADRCYVSRNTITAWLTGRSIPGPLEREKLAEVTGIDFVAEDGWRK